MRLIPTKYTENWQKQINSLVDNEAPLNEDFSSNRQFPWENVWQYTATYMVNKKALSGRVELDERLLKLIIKSTKKEVALAACSRLLSPEALRTFMRDCNLLDIVDYLRLVLVAHYGGSLTVDTTECKTARLLLEAHRDFKYDASQYYRSLFEIMNEGIVVDSLVYPVLHTEAIKVIPQLASDLSNLREENQWFMAWKIAVYLSKIPDTFSKLSPNHLNPIELLDRNFRGWRIWTKWRPGLHIISQDKLSYQQFGLLRSLLHLAGPDDTKPTVCERLITQGLEIESTMCKIGTLSFQVQSETQKEVRDMLRRVYEVLGKAYRAGGYQADLLIELCIENTITLEALNTLEAISAANCGNPELLAILNLFKARSKPQHEQIQQCLVLLPLIGGKALGKLRKAIAPFLTVHILDQVTDLQSSLRTYWHAKTFGTETQENKLCDIITALKTASSPDTSWFSETADSAFMELFTHWPTSVELSSLQNLRTFAQGETSVAGRSLLERVMSYYKDVFVQRGSVTEDTRVMMKALMSFHTTSPTSDQLIVSVLIADGEGKFRSDCISQLSELPEAFVASLKVLLQDWMGDEHQKLQACELLAKMLATNTSLTSAFTCWKPVLYRMLSKLGHQLIDIALHSMNAKDWLAFLRNLRAVFGDKVKWNPKMSPAVMRPGLHKWAQRLQEQISFLAILEKESRTQKVVPYILLGGEERFQDTVEVIMLLFPNESSISMPRCKIILEIISQLSNELSNAEELWQVTASVSKASQGCISTCLRLIEFCEDGSADVARLLFRGWVQEASSKEDQLALTEVGGLFGVEDSNPDYLLGQTIERAAAYVDNRYTKLLADARRLDRMRIELKVRDPRGTAKFLAEHKIQDTSAIEDSFARLPRELLDVVERIGDADLEILFPLNKLTQLQRHAMGIGSSQSLLLRLQIGDYGVPPRFCFHFDDEPKIDSHLDVHSQWVVFKFDRAPELPVCHGTVTPATYSLARALSRYLAEDGFKSVQLVHSLIAKKLITMGSECISCGIPHKAPMLRKATICDSIACKEIFSRANVEIRLADIRHDPAAVDMLLSMVYSAINSGYHHLLTGCPFSKEKVLNLYKTMPAMNLLSKSKYFAVKIKQCGAEMEQFLTWVCCNFRGFLSSATGPTRIPSLPPGTQQFLLSNAAPLKEVAFANEIGGSPTKVVFHGTSIDRLYPILCQGLRVMSGTSLQAYGAVSGPGIYLADDPNTSWVYADRIAAGRKNWKASSIKMGRILLGCELAGAVTSNGIHVITKESSVMVRYIFVVPSSTVTLPIAGHLVPAMSSVFNSLRSGAL